MLKHKKPISESKFNSVIDQALIEKKLVILDKNFKEIPKGGLRGLSAIFLRHSVDREAFVYYNGFVYTREINQEYCGGCRVTSPKATYWRYKVIPVQAFCIDTTYRGEPQ